MADRLREKASVRAIAAELGRSPSTHRKPGDPPQRTLMSNGGSYYTPRPPKRRMDAPTPRPKPGKIAEPRAAGLPPEPPGSAVEPGADLPRSPGTLP
ncbi:hypothetical protein [Streptomyces sp. NPDC048720]|uniref:helix-turn-helix domain-containing protein n=1 Tax=Streptomyces sp. NPDC048720 TaxID=3365588 RepID=UPI0037102222